MIMRFIKQQFALRKAARDLYLSGKWTTENLGPDREAELWDDLRIALGLKVGTATLRGIARDH